MNKLFTSIAVASLSLTMAVGVGVAVGHSSRSAQKVDAAATDGTQCVLFNSSSPYTASDAYTTSSDGAIKWKNSASNTYSNPTRIYANATFTIEIADFSKASSINGVIIEAGDASYATVAGNANWSVTGGSGSVSNTVSSSTVTATTSGTVTSLTIKPTAQTRWSSVTVYYAASSGGGPQETMKAMSGKIWLIKAGAYYVGNDVSSSATATAKTSDSDAKRLLFTLADANDTYYITDANDSTKYLNCTTTNGANLRLNTTQCKWVLTGKTLSSGTDGSFTLTHVENSKILTCYQGSNWRIYNAGSTSNRAADLDFEEYTEKVVTALSVSPSSWTGYDSETIDVSDYTVSVTTNGAAGTSDDYEFQGIGSGAGDQFVARDSSFTSGHPTTSDTRLQWKAKYPNTSGGSTFLYAYVTLNVTADSLSSIAVGGSMTTTSYSLGSDWNPAGLTVSAYYSSAPSTPVDVTSEATWTWDPAKASSTTITSVVPTAHFGGEEADGNSQSVTVTAVTSCTYDFVTNFGTYASSWANSYTAHTVTSTDLDATIAGSFSMSAAKQGSTITDRPVLSGKNADSLVIYTLDSSISSQYSVDTVTVNYSRWSSDSATVALYKGNTTATELTTATLTAGTISASVNDSQFIFAIKNNNGSNARCGLTSIAITLKAAESFGTLDHIKVVSVPTKTIYNVGDQFDTTGIEVIAYDNATEAQAHTKDVTSSATSSVANGHTFTSSEASKQLEVTVSYTEGSTKTDSYYISVYDFETYQLVTEEPTSWDGKYIIAATVGEDDVALRSAISSIDVVPNFNDIVTDSSSALAGKDLEFTFTQTGEGTVTIQNVDDKYLATSSDATSNDIQLSNSSAELSISFDAGQVTIGASSKTLRVNTTSGQERFRFFKNATGTTIRLYKYVVDVSAYVEYFNETLEDICKTDNTTNVDDLNVAWALLAAEFDNLTSEQKAVFTGGEADDQGSDVEKVLAQYDWTAGRYNTQLESQDCPDYDFMGRNIQPTQRIGTSLFAGLDTQSTTAIIVVVALTSVTAIGAIIFIKRRKYN